MMQLSDFDYILPESLIAHYPLAKRDQCRLLHIRRHSLELSHHCFNELTFLLRPGDLLVTNNTKVIPARLYAYKSSGGKVEILLNKKLSNHSGHYQAMMKSSQPVKKGSHLAVADDFSIEVLQTMNNGFYEIMLHAPHIPQALSRYGHIPLPPYIQRPDEEGDSHHYQTIFAQHDGSCAAPTAGLHFTEELFASCQQKGISHVSITLHVGAGTFLPIRESAQNDIRLHRMHSETYEISQESAKTIKQAIEQKRRIIAVGTTSMRTLEAVAHQHGDIIATQGETDLFITPGFSFRVVDGLITNFHLPRSTLLILVSAFAGQKTIQNAYAEAILQNYRFFSYGDACLMI